MGNRLIFVALALLTLTGCASTDPIYLRHAGTGPRVQCGPFSMTTGPQALAAPFHERSCLDDYQRQGYVRVME